MTGKSSRDCDDDRVPIVQEPKGPSHRGPLKIRDSPRKPSCPKHRSLLHTSVPLLRLWSRLLLPHHQLTPPFCATRRFGQQWQQETGNLVVTRPPPAAQSCLSSPLAAFKAEPHVAFHSLESPQADVSPGNRHRHSPSHSGAWVRAGAPPGRFCASIRASASAGAGPLAAKTLPRNFYLVAYPLMLLSRRLEQRLWNCSEGLRQGDSRHRRRQRGHGDRRRMPFRPGPRRGVAAAPRLRRPSALGATPYELLCQYLANADSPTHGREGNVHHGDAPAGGSP